MKPEVRESETDSVEFVFDKDEDVRQLKIEPDPRQLTVRVAALAIRQPTSAASRQASRRSRSTTSFG